MKQYKGSGVVIMGKLKYHEKCLMILENRNFKTLDHDPTTKRGRKSTTTFTKSENQIITTKIFIFLPKWILSGQVLWNSYKISEKGTVDKLPLSQLFQTLEVLHTI